MEIRPEIRPERPEEYDEIGRVVAAAFHSPAEARLVEAIRASPHYLAELALVAVVDGAIAGHVMISHTALRDGERMYEIVHLSPLAVAPERQGHGIGSALVRAVTAAADERGLPLVALEGDPRYYSRFGFEHSVKFGIHIDLPSWAPPEAAQVLRLRAYDPAIRGVVVYPPAFATLGEHH